ncbi:membrane dipeptidase [Hyphococcus flavus]|uniref:Membrane dipeptidase n=1 Tax=Hyphococcus flavus TaxID=1866326 RepID=A0AAE9ZHN5_9PROT|nr:membrane dipeptidase [Hyphococcus flavus]WDI33017.1 membrane dipeptidase [Hyphococcus flavus]
MQYTRRDAISLGAAAAVTFSTSRAAELPGKLKRLYDNALVIDALSFARDWDDVEYEAVQQSGYTGIITSLNRRDLQTAIDELVTWRTRVEEYPDRYMIALEARDFERAKREKKLAVMMNFQNATMLEGDVDNVDALHALGMRCFQLTYNSRNRLGDGSTERTNVGLSDFGIEVVERMNKLGVLVDLSHCGRQTTLDGIEFSEKPVAITHSMIEKFRPGHPRAKVDEQIKALADKGGVFGVAALGYFIGTDPGGETTIETYADHIEHAVNVAGIEHVALSTDFPVRGIASWATKEDWYEPRLKSFKPSYDVKWPPYIPELDTPDRFRNLLVVLDRRGWKTRDLERLLGENWMRLFRDVFGN